MMIAKPTKIWLAIASIILAIWLIFPSSPSLANPQPTQTKQTIVNLTGTIRKLAVEGTCYQLITNDGKKYELIGKFPKRDGVKVRVRGIVDQDMATICQVGQPIQVKSVRVLK
jgi:hypothetical protein